MKSGMRMEYAQQGDIDTLYTLIDQNPSVLKEIDSVSYVETPLHVVARAGHVQFASFSWKFNLQGFRPIHLVLEHGHVIMVTVRVKMRGGLTLMHLASQSGDINFLTVILKTCPDSVKDLTTRNETALRFAVKYQKFEAFKFWLRTNTIELQIILKQKDMEGFH